MWLPFTSQTPGFEADGTTVNFGEAPLLASIADPSPQITLAMKSPATVTVPAVRNEAIVTLPVATLAFASSVSELPSMILSPIPTSKS